MLPITLDEYKRIKSYIKEHNIQPTDMVRPEGIYVKCPFYDFDNKICKVYEVRPEVCKAFSCANKLKLVDKNRNYYDARADINGNHMDRVVPMDLLFYGSPVMTFVILQSMFEVESPIQLFNYLNRFAGDQEFFRKNKINNAQDIINGITSGQIELKWSDNNDTKN